jgi:hypothetical protein
VYVAGGYNGSSAVSTLTAFTPSTGTWATMASMAAVHDTAAIALDVAGHIYVMGGKDVATNPSSVVEVYTP